MPPPLQVNNIIVFIRQVAPVPGNVVYLRHQQQVDLWPFDLESGVRVTCDVGYLCANFSLPRPLCSWVTPDVRDRRQTDVRQKHRLMRPPYRGGGIIRMMNWLEVNEMETDCSPVYRAQILYGVQLVSSK